MVALVAAGCDSGSESAEEPPPVTTAPEPPPATPAPPATTAEEQPPPAASTSDRVYAKKDLPKLALQPADAPMGMRYTKVESGPKTFFDVGFILDDQIAEVEALKLRGIYDAIFDSTTTDMRLATRLWLFAEPAGAKRWLEKSESDATLYAFEPIDAPALADGSWAARGNVNGSDVISHAFRAGNVVVVVTFSTQSLKLSPPEALAAAEKAVERIRHA